MNNAKVSFSFNEKEGLAELRRRQDEAGATSLGLYVKQLVLEHLARDDDQFAQLSDAVDQLRQTVLQSASMLTELSRRTDAKQSTIDVLEELEALRGTLAMMFCGLLQESLPLSREEAVRFARQALGDED